MFAIPRQSQDGYFHYQYVAGLARQASSNVANKTHHFDLEQAIVFFVLDLIRQDL